MKIQQTRIDLQSNFVAVSRLFDSVYSNRDDTLTQFRMCLFRAAHGSREGNEGAKKPPSLKSVTHILQLCNLAQLHLT